jgi:hypothetical protein
VNVARQKLPPDSGDQRKRVVMNKAFRTLVNDGIEVSVDTGLRVAEKLQFVLDGREQGTNVAKIMVHVNHIIEAARSTVPQEIWGEIKRKLNEAERHSEPVDIETEALDEADEVFDPIEFADEDDDF